MHVNNIATGSFQLWIYVCHFFLFYLHRVVTFSWWWGDWVPQWCWLEFWYSCSPKPDR